MDLVQLQSLIRTVPDFPKPGILFRDITPLLNNAAAIDALMDQLHEAVVTSGIEFNVIAAIEARGFLFGPTLARDIGARFVPIRKPGKLPGCTDKVTYDLEYGQDSLEIHSDALDSNDRVLIVDDVLATGGTVKAATTLVHGTGAKIAGMAFLITLAALPGKQELSIYHTVSLFEF
jgi:adenine phosphoribosyltransferase